MTTTGYAPGLRLPEPCPARRHGLGATYVLLDTEFDSHCQTCAARKVIRGDHDHLHLNGEECTTPGLNGAPGRNVKCKCGGYHH
jgi:hypothetical protein